MKLPLKIPRHWHETELGKKNLYKYHFWLGGLLEKEFFTQTLIQASDEESLMEASCKISTRSDDYFKSYAVFSIFFLVGWLVCRDSSAFFKTHQNIGEEPS